MLPEVKKLKSEIWALATELGYLNNGITALAPIQTAVVIPLTAELKAIYNRRKTEQVKLLEDLSIIQANCLHKWEYTFIVHECALCGLTTEY